MEIYDSIAALKDELGVNEKTVAELLANNVIPSISYGVKKKAYYTNSEFIKYAENKISAFFGKKFNSRKELFSMKELREEGIYDKIYTSKTTTAHVLGICNQKGGVGKTTTSTNTSAALAFGNKKVLLVDTDSQSQSSRAFFNQRRDGQTIKNLFDLFKEDRTKINKDEVKKYIYTQELGDFTIDILPSELKLAKTMELIRMEPMNHTALDTILNCVKDEYDYIVIDTPPNPGMALEVSIYASDSVVIATNSEDWGKEGVEETIKEITYFSSVVHKKLPIDAIVVNEFGRTSTEYEILEEYYDMIASLNLDADDNLLIIDKNVVIPDSQKARTPILNYATNKSSAIKVMKATSETYKLINLLESRG